MTNNEFKHWLNGFFLLSPDDIVLNTQQFNVIRNHLNLAATVEGKLDNVNELFRKRISETIDNNSEPDQQARAELTQELKIHLHTVLNA